VTLALFINVLIIIIIIINKIPSYFIIIIFTCPSAVKLLLSLDYLMRIWQKILF